MKLHSLDILANVQSSGTVGGAEIFHKKLAEAFSRYVDCVDLVEVPCCEDSFDTIMESYRRCYDLNVLKYDAVLSSKAPTFAVRHPNHVCYLMHTVRVFYDMFEELNAHPVNFERRQLLFRMDKELLSPPRTKAVYTIGEEVPERIRKYIGIESTALHPGMTDEGFYTAQAGDYIYLPGRLHRWKRVDLCIEAMGYVKTPVRLKIAGSGEQEQELRALSANLPRVEFLGRVSDEEMKCLYANALAVAFTPLREDYGYILHEAFKSEKPVLTCTDSGEPARFIRSGENGFLCGPDPREIAARFDEFYLHREKTAAMGRCGKKSIESITWDAVVETLLPVLEEKLPR
ncbi:MAG: glycosyltransferase family 4 protein [Clostridiales bacterium]|nr:glycosyltransferase family 4 protein [Candidatus Apopatocola equi]